MKSNPILLNSLKLILELSTKLSIRIKETALPMNDALKIVIVWSVSLRLYEQ